MLPRLQRLRLEAPESVTDGIFDNLLGKRKQAEEQEKEEEEEEGEEELAPPIKLLILDFDLTMTTTTYPINKRGVAKRDVTADKTKLFTQGMSKQNHVDNFGGEERVERMKELFDELIANGTELRILSYGTKEAIVHALEEVGLADYFTEKDEELGNLVFGTDVPPLNDPPAEGEDPDKVVDKLGVVAQWLDELDLNGDEVLFLDDDIANIRTPIELGSDDRGVAQILYPGHARLHPYGYFEQSEPWIREMCGLEPRGEAAAGEAGPSGA
jgi:hypothetical protein